MSFFESIRRSATNATFEAQRLLRVQRQQGVISSLRKLRDEDALALGTRVVEKAREGSLEDGELRELAGLVLDLDRRIQREQEELERIRTEQPPDAPAQPTAPAGTLGPADGSGACASCGAPLEPGAAFCTNCGAPAFAPAPEGSVTVPVPMPPTSGEAARPEGDTPAAPEASETPAARPDPGTPDPPEQAEGRVQFTWDPAVQETGQHNAGPADTAPAPTFEAQLLRDVPTSNEEAQEPLPPSPQPDRTP